MTTLITQVLPALQKEQQRPSRRFQRKTEIDRSPLRRSDSISSASSDTSLQKFYTHSSKIKNIENESFETNRKACSEETIFFMENEFDNTFDKEEEFVKRLDSKEQEEMGREIKCLRERNVELEMKLEEVTKVLKDHMKKENQFTNKKRDSIRKERTKELESENTSLKRQIEDLKEQIEDIRTSKLTEDTQNSINEYENSSSWTRLEDYVGDKEIFELNETIRRLHIEIDSLKRRNHFQFELLKMNHEKELKKTKEKLMEVMQANIKIGKKNMELRNSLRKQEFKGCECFETEVMSRSISLLSLSSDE